MKTYSDKKQASHVFQKKANKSMSRIIDNRFLYKSQSDLISNLNQNNHIKQLQKTPNSLIIQRQITMKDSDRPGEAQRSDGTETQLTNEVVTTIANNNQTDIRNTISQLRNSIAARRSALDSSTDSYDSHLYRVQVEERLLLRLQSALAPNPLLITRASPSPAS